MKEKSFSISYLQSLTKTSCAIVGMVSGFVRTTSRADIVILSHHWQMYKKGVSRIYSAGCSCVKRRVANISTMAAGRLGDLLVTKHHCMTYYDW